MLKHLGLGMGVLLFLASSSSAWAWGRRGHSMVCETAAYLAAAEPKGDFLKDHSFDLGYYCNVPDFLWKDPATVETERPQHYIDLEIFERVLHGADFDKSMQLDRQTFFKKHPEVPSAAGRAWWRIREMDDLLSADRDQLMSKDLKKEARFAGQGNWLVHAGVMGHYIGDMSMPMHITENHDGQITHQKGIHSYFEDEMVNELVHQPDGFNLNAAVWKLANERWKKEKAKLAKLSIYELIRDESIESFKDLPEVLKLDRQIGRKNLTLAANAQRTIIVRRLASGAVYLAEYYRRALGMDFDNNRFYNFSAKPEYIELPK